MADHCNFLVATLTLFRHAKAKDWSQQFTQCWDTFCTGIDHLDQVRRQFASTMQTAIVPDTEAFAVQHEGQVKRLVTGAFVFFACMQGVSEN